MTIAELLSLLGLAWLRLLIFPSGLFALGIVLALEWATARTSGGMPKYDDIGILSASALILPWLGLALLPLPLAAPLARPIDLIALIALLEWPRLLAIAAALRSNNRARTLSGVRRLGGALNSYPPIILAALVMAHATGTLESAGLARLPAADTAPLEYAWFWAGALALTLALPPLLELGPFAGGADHGMIRLAMRLRALGIILLAALPWLAPLARDDTPTLLRLLLPAPPLLLAALLWAFHRATGGHSVMRWARVYLGYDLALLGLLLAAGLLALRERLS